MEYYSEIQKSEILSLQQQIMNLEGIIPMNKVKDNTCVCIFIWALKNKK